MFAPIPRIDEAGSVENRGGGGKITTVAFPQTPSKLKVVTFPKRFSAIPPAVNTSIFQDSSAMLMTVELLGVTSHVCQKFGTEGAAVVPYLSVLAAPLYLRHSAQRAYERLSLARDAAKVGRVSDMLFWGGRGFDAAGGALGNISKTFSGGVQLLGLSGTAVCALIFAHIIPTILVITGAIGGFAQVAALWRARNASHDFEQTVALKDVNALLRYLEGPPHEEAHADKVALETFQRNYRLDREKFMAAHFTSEERYNVLRDHIRERSHSPTFATASQKENLRRCVESLTDIGNGYQSQLTGELSIEALLGLYNQIEDLATGQLLETVQSSKAELLNNLSMQRMQPVIDRTRSEMHRVQLYHLIFILMTALILTDGTLSLISPDLADLAGNIAIASSLLDIAYVLFDKNVSQDNFLRLEKLLGTV